LSSVTHLLGASLTAAAAAVHLLLRFAEGTTPNRPWMGMRARLSSSFNCNANLTTPEVGYRQLNCSISMVAALRAATKPAIFAAAAPFFAIAALFADDCASASHKKMQCCMLVHEVPTAHLPAAACVPCYLQAKVICTAMQRYGVILADVGSPW
jgi:hypothetical protein